MAIVKGKGAKVRPSTRLTYLRPHSSSNRISASSRRSLNSFLAHAFGSGPSSVSLITGTGFIFSWGADRGIHWILDQLPFIDQPHAKPVQAAIPNLDCARLVIFAEHGEPLADCGPVQLVKSRLAAMRFEPPRKERHRLPVQPQRRRAMPVGAEVAQERALHWR
jgi:hypothetical protein